MSSALIRGNSSNRRRWTHNIYQVLRARSERERRNSRISFEPVQQHNLPRPNPPPSGGGDPENKKYRTPHTITKDHNMYGTAWKKEKTADLVAKAVKAGFRHIDTACQPRHYNEAGVGDGWVAAARELNLDRTDVWLQTKFSGLTAHDPNNVPYDVNASLEDRVRQSLQKSLENLKTDYLDSWIMHGPEDNWDDHWEVWRTMESAVDEGKVRQLGIANFYRLEDVEWAYAHARIKPKVVQNRFYADSGHDVEIRAFCKEHDIEYQSFWTLTGNPNAFHHQAAHDLSIKKKLSVEALFYAFCMAIGISPLDGTTDEMHMKEATELMDRIRGGEEIFQNKEEMEVIGNALGTPGWNTEDEL